MQQFACNDGEAPSDRRNVPARIRIAMSANLHPTSKIVNKFKTIEFSGETGLVLKPGDVMKTVAVYYITPPMDKKIYNEYN